MVKDMGRNGPCLIGRLYIPVKGPYKWSNGHDVEDEVGDEGASESYSNHNEPTKQLSQQTLPVALRGEKKSK